MLEDALKKLIEISVEYAPKLLLAIVTLVVGLWVINSITKFFGKRMKKSNMDESLQPFLRTMIDTLLKVALVISIMGMVGIEMTSFIAILGAAGLAIGMALSGTLQNFAGGVLILILKPYKVGDLIGFGGMTGYVKEIQIFATIIETPDNIRHIIPNSPISTGTLTNYSSLPTKRQDWVYGIGYSSDIDKAKAILKRLAAEEPKVLKSPEPVLFVNKLADSSVNIALRVYVSNDDAPAGSTILSEKVKKAFDAEGIQIPFPQQDVHLFKVN